MVSLDKSTGGPRLGDLGLGVSNYVHSNLRRAYIIAISTLLLLSVLGQGIMQYALSSEQKDALLVNRAGRQRMLSQKITKELLLVTSTSVSQVEKDKYLTRLKGDLSDWSSIHEALSTGDKSIGADELDSTAIKELLTAISPVVKELETVSRKIIARVECGSPASEIDPLVRRSLEIEPVFLIGMDDLVKQYQIESQQKVFYLKLLEFVLFLTTLGALIIEAFFIFKPALLQARQAIKIIESEKVLSEIRSIRYLETAELARQALVENDRKGVLERAVRLITKFLKADVSSVVEIKDDEKLQVVAMESKPESRAVSQTHSDLDRLMVPADSLECGEKSLEKLTTTVRNAAIKTGAKADDLKSTVSAPIHGPHEPFGFISVHFKDDFELKQEEQSFLCSVGNLLGIIYESYNTRDNLKAREEKLSCILDSVLDVILVIDSDGKIDSCNKAANAVFGLAPDKLKGTRLEELVHITAADEAGHVPGLKELLGISKSLERYEALAATAGGEQRPIEVCFAPLGGQATNALAQYVAVITDCSDRKKIERRISEFYSTVSHELRTPLTSISGSLRLMEGGIVGALPEEAKQLVRIGRIEADRLIRLVSDLLDIRKLQSNAFAFNLAYVSSAEFLRKRLNALKYMAQTDNIELDADVRTKANFYGDEDRVAQALTNLIANAIKFSPDGAKVVVTVEERPAALGAVDMSMIRFSVKDQGPGIALEDQGKLFKLFQQLDSSDSREKGGTGLGLAISKELVERQGGRIGLESSPGQGSNFWFEMPAKDKDKDQYSSGGN